ncbi:MAG: DUF177 domain-containing protein [Xanthobacteraceae bacterium]|nr:DUF177 domain-containing protein [Xanthobacteraceae bacterium]
MTAPGHPKPSDPWRKPVVLEAIPETGLVLEFEASADEREAMRKLAGLRDLTAARARFEVSRVGRDRARAVGRVTATLGQTCIVTLEPIETGVDEEVDTLFVPESEIEAVTRAMDKEAESTGEMADVPEPIVNGVMDLGKLAADTLFLAIDPYPRKPDARFEPPVVAEDPEDHPFAALKALQGKTPPKSDAD